MITCDLAVCSEWDITFRMCASLKITLAHFDNVVRLIHGNVSRLLNDALVEVSKFYRVCVWGELKVHC